jgi:prolyl oligopeptidase
MLPSFPRLSIPSASLAICVLMGSTAFSDPSPWQYPPAAKGPQVDDYFGTKVADPYRWLEDPDSAQTTAWVEAENKLTFDYLRHIPSRPGIEKRVTQLWDYEKYGVPEKEGGRYFFSKNTGLQNQRVIFTSANLEQPARELLDPNKLSADGTVALESYAISDNGQYMAYGLQTSGSDWIDWHVKDVATGIDLPDHLKWSKFSGASWTKDDKGFFYSHYDAPNEKTQLRDANYYHKLYYHLVGEEQDKDQLIYERKDQKEWLFDGGVTDDGKYLIINVEQGTDPKNRIFYRTIDDGLTASPVVELLNNADAHYQFAGNQGTVFYFVTNLNAPRGRLVAVDTARSGPPELREILAQSTETLDGVTLIGGRFVASYLKDAHTEVKVFGLDGKPVTSVEFPGLGTAAGFGGKPDDPETFYSFTSYTTPPTIYRYDVKTGESKAVFAPKVDFKPGDYTTEQVFFNSKDGTRVPMFISYKKGMTRDGNNPTLLYGYGGFDISLTPSFSPADLVWMEMGGIYAVANLRGGGEYGEEWHLAGTKAHKQNVFDDFIGAAEWLIAQHYTSTPKLAIQGGSNGGLLIGACLTQRPDLYGAALAAVGVMDMLRFQKFTIGWAWASDYGSSDDPEQFKTLYTYSPLHHLKPGVHYPATLVTTSDHDDRVVPAHSYKFAATLQADQGGPAPVLIRIETKSGHGGGRPTSKRIAEVADAWAFLDEALGVTAKATEQPAPTIKP